MILRREKRKHGYYAKEGLRFSFVRRASLESSRSGAYESAVLPARVAKACVLFDSVFQLLPALSGPQLPSQDNSQIVQASEPKCRCPLRSRSGQPHLRETLHEIKDRNLPLKPCQLTPDARVRARTERKVLVVQP